MNNQVSDIRYSPKSLSQEHDVTPRSIVLWLQRKYFGKFREADQLPEHCVEAWINRKPKKKKSKNINPVQSITAAAPISKAPKPSVLNFFESITKLDLINYLEMGLIIFGLSQMYRVAGFILSIMLCLLLINSQAIAKDPKLKRTNENSLQVVLWICIASFFLHFFTFWNNAPEIFKDANWMQVTCSIIPAMFVSILSFKAIEITKNIAQKK